MSLNRTLKVRKRCAWPPLRGILSLKSSPVNHSHRSRFALNINEHACIRTRIRSRRTRLQSKVIKPVPDINTIKLQVLVIKNLIHRHICVSYFYFPKYMIKVYIECPGAQSVYYHFIFHKSILTPIYTIAKHSIQRLSRITIMVCKRQYRECMIDKSIRISGHCTMCKIVSTTITNLDIFSAITDQAIGSYYPCIDRNHTSIV